MWSKFRNFFAKDRETRRLLLEALIYLAWARILKALPFSRVAPSLGVQMEETSLELDPQYIPFLKKVSRAVNSMSRYTLWESKCLVKAMAAMKMLEKRSIDSTLYLGTCRDAQGKLAAHAWLRSGPLYLTGAEEMHSFTVVGKFAKKTAAQLNQRSTSNG